ncbi:SWI/SNF complex subunit SMARCC2 [Fusarium oxysporum f. sp. albedinis]|nr:SWI/SNF complex subunit SMARCC2 [Fusarium oxysporum f. sp. albedinis]
MYLSGRGMDYASSWDMIEVVVLTQDKVAGSWPTEAYMDRRRPQAETGPSRNDYIIIDHTMSIEGEGTYDLRKQ